MPSTFTLVILMMGQIAPFDGNPMRLEISGYKTMRACMDAENFLILNPPRGLVVGRSGCDHPGKHKF